MVLAQRAFSALTLLCGWQEHGVYSSWKYWFSGIFNSSWKCFKSRGNF